MMERHLIERRKDPIAALVRYFPMFRPRALFPKSAGAVLAGQKIASEAIIGDHADLVLRQICSSSPSNSDRS